MNKVICTILASLFLIISFSGCGMLDDTKKAAELQKQILTLEAELQLRQQENQILKEKYDMVMAEAKNWKEKFKVINEKIPDIEKLEQEIKTLEKAVEQERKKI
jgi:peptidoglycan hydrolase CwlO-like protein